ncbi:alpha/beta fold hydrolase [Lacibacter sediminis]|uniref:Alpha/beta hydrolase n=1 Tax=Lacibacter sediminis TaxID=2760713 RepID=A0A7G5XCK6_9BACT|nr:alpha/beta hydrolase [Lacibacter sediminis]QNA43209.1 alpha/beta hydrolase [Lacibacter sediminis]
MKYQHINIEGIQLAFLESKGITDDIIFLVHGNSTSARSWNKQLKSPDLSSYRMIAFDLPEHSESGSLVNTRFTCSLPQLGEILSAAVKQLSGNNRFILAGVSLGTNIIAETLKYSIHPSGIALIGSCVIGGEFTLEKIFKKNIDLHAGFTDSVSEHELKKYAALAFSSDEEKDWLDFSTSYYQVKNNFRSKMFASVAAGDFSNEIDLLIQQSAPVLVIFGEDEKVCEPDYLDEAGLNLWENRTFKIENAGHFVNNDNPEVLNSLLGEFASEVFR